MGTYEHAAIEHSRPLRVCVAVDDFGLHEGVNWGALALIAAGRVQAVGCMVGAPAWRQGSGELSRIDPRKVDIGLHLDLTEHPLLPGSRRELRSLILASYTGRLDAHALRAEVAAQLDAFESATGRAPSYVDGHQHVHQLPGVRRVVLDELGRRYPQALPWLRGCRRPSAGYAARREGGAIDIKPHVIDWLGSRSLAALARSRGFVLNQHLLGVYDFLGGSRRYARLLTGWLCSAGDADLLMCHASATAPAADPLGAARHAEFEVLSGPSFLTAVGAADLRLMPMRQILAEQR